MICEPGSLGVRGTMKVITVEADKVLETDFLSKTSESACLKHNYVIFQI